MNLFQDYDFIHVGECVPGDMYVSPQGFFRFIISTTQSCINDRPTSTRVDYIDDHGLGASGLIMTVKAGCRTPIVDAR